MSQYYIKGKMKKDWKIFWLVILVLAIIFSILALIFWNIFGFYFVAEDLKTAPLGSDAFNEKLRTCSPSVGGGFYIDDKWKIEKKGFENCELIVDIFTKMVNESFIFETAFICNFPKEVYSKPELINNETFNYYCESFIDEIKKTSVGESCGLDIDCGENFTCYNYQCMVKECKEDVNCSDNKYCDSGICKEKGCLKDSDCQEGYHCSGFECRKTLSTKETKEGYIYETMLEDNMTFIWCNINSCPTDYKCESSFCRKKCFQDSDCSKNQFCAVSYGVCDWNKDYWDYK
jgi:hypothetical protein